MPEYPILQQNKPIGTLRVTREGLHTVFSARAKTDAPRLRLAVCGARSRAYLGLMLPDGARTRAAVRGRWPGCALVFRAGRRAHDV